MNAKKIFLVLILAGIFVLQTSAVFAQSDETVITKNFNESNDIAGSWMVTVSPAGGTPFKALITFDKGGGVIGSAQGDILLDAPPGIPPIATAVHGAWERVGNNQFLFTFRQIFYGADGSFQGGNKIRNLVTLNSKGDAWSGQLQFEWYDADGNVVFSGAGTQQATRIQAEPLTP